MLERSRFTLIEILGVITVIFIVVMIIIIVIFIPILFPDLSLAPNTDNVNFPNPSE